MTDSEKRIADYILDHPERIYKISINELAKIIDVSLPTVFRFAKTLGFEGFKDFKVELIKDMAIGLNISVENTEDSSIENITNNIFQKDIHNLKETLSIINYDDLKKAVDNILTSKRIIFFAVSSSISVAMESYSKFIRAGFSCYYNPDTYSQTIVSLQTNTYDTAIAISFSGESTETLRCLRNAKENGAKTIAVTTFMKSSITKYADIVFLTAPVSSHYQKIDMPSKISQNALLDSIYLNTVLNSRHKSLKYISRAENELENIKDNNDKT
jgi:RpiR family transcriptional regulator, carbohydrate utilization regulator